MMSAVLPTLHHVVMRDVLSLVWWKSLLLGL